MNFPLLLLPDEICLLDDYDVFFELYCEPTGFNFLGYRDVDVELRCQSYLTSNRVQHLKIRLTIVNLRSMELKTWFLLNLHRINPSPSIR
jgi:hypothetical protein